MTRAYVPKAVSRSDRWCYVKVVRGKETTYDRIRLTPEDTRQAIQDTLLGVYGVGDIMWKQTGWGCEYVCK